MRQQHHRSAEKVTLETKWKINTNDFLTLSMNILQFFVFYIYIFFESERIFKIDDGTNYIKKVKCS